MKSILLPTLLATAFLLPFTSHAAKGSGQVERIYPNNGKVYFRLKGDECKDKGSRNTYWYIDLSTETGKASYSLLLTAATTESVIVVGRPSSSCSPEVTQQVNYIYQDF
ncbi:hypothetical protein [Pseudoalteromonas byunsanensis]|uniref:Uncharacterized protein n=1 Tax=Pseudoalteromonas byunsanensis TaxID=327939 RepID=A0A1S1N359_9GAMM|nr:hypothetical protein [Pseudoalteromonas byunsanensis]OHU93748.1 hypothetical protein BIW53_18600 [Pseudoalteromonas byunsanensis]